MPYDVGFMIAAAFVVFIVGLSKSGLASGLGSLAVPLLALFLPPPRCRGNSFATVDDH